MSKSNLVVCENENCLVTAMEIIGPVGGVTTCTECGCNLVVIPVPLKMIGHTDKIWEYHGVDAEYPLFAKMKYDEQKQYQYYQTPPKRLHYGGSDSVKTNLRWWALVDREED